MQLLHLSSSNAAIIIACCSTVIGFPFGLCVVLYFLPSFIPDSAKTRFSKIPLGLLPPPSKPSRKSHAILEMKSPAPDVSFLSTYVASLPRSGRHTMLKQQPRAFSAFNVTVTTSHSPSKLGFSHFLVLYEHEKDSYSSKAWTPLYRVKALLIASLRFFSARMMVGCVDSYYVPSAKISPDTGSSSGPISTSATTTTSSSSPPVLIAWSQSLVLGDTLRAMWFYQNSFARKNGLYIWYGCVVAAIARLDRMRKENEVDKTGGADKCGDKVRWIDLGPSTSDSSRAVKVNVGFEDRLDWRKLANYDCGNGMFKQAPEYKELVFDYGVGEDKECRKETADEEIRQKKEENKLKQKKAQEEKRRAAEKEGGADERPRPTAKKEKSKAKKEGGDKNEENREDASAALDSSGVHVHLKKEQ